MLARTGSVINHWYWGSIVHDMSGLTERKPIIAVDYCHEYGEILGFADSQKANAAGLTLSGMLTPFHETDRASEILFKGKAGVPYEASISFDYSELEFVQDGETATVNGQIVLGSCYIVRKWTLIGVAICPYGDDGRSWTEVS
jgi:hypothetical protein